MGNINDFYKGYTKAFTVTCKISGEVQDITEDTVTLILKTNEDDADADAILDQDADVSDGSEGVASFLLTDEITELIDVGEYFLSIRWDRDNGRKYYLHKQKINVLQPV